MHGMHHGNFQRLFWINLILTIPTLVFSTGLQDILGLSGPRFPGSQWIPAAFGTAIFLLGGRVFLSGAVGELRAKQPGMMTLISLAILVAFGYSLAVTFGLHGMDFWWELATLITIMLLGHWIEMAAVMGASDALGELAKLLPDEAEVLHGEHTMTDAGVVPVASATWCWCGRAHRSRSTARWSTANPRWMNPSSPASPLRSRRRSARRSWPEA